MAVTTTNIELGAGSLYFIEWADATTDPGGEPDSTGTDVGLTLGADFTYTQEVIDVEGDQFMAPVAGFMTGEKSEFKITLEEQALKNLAMALGLVPSTAISSTVSVGQWLYFGGKQNPQYYRLLYKVPWINDSSKNWKYYFYKARVSSGLALNFSKKEPRKFEITFTLYPVNPTAGTAAGSRLGEVRKWQS